MLMQQLCDIVMLTGHGRHILYVVLTWLVLADSIVFACINLVNTHYSFFSRYIKPNIWWTLALCFLICHSGKIAHICILFSCLSRNAVLWSSPEVNIQIGNYVALWWTRNPLASMVYFITSFLFLHLNFGPDESFQPWRTSALGLPHMWPRPRTPRLGPESWGAGGPWRRRGLHHPPWMSPVQDRRPLRAPLARRWTCSLCGRRRSYAHIYSMWPRLLRKDSEVLGRDPVAPWDPRLQTCLPLLLHCPRLPQLVTAYLPGSHWLAAATAAVAVTGRQLRFSHGENFLEQVQVTKRCANISFILLQLVLLLYIPHVGIEALKKTF